ncbi:tRNA epoxyqueuosine(34) reductase QueG [Garciella nitratireducens]|uniref:tRNA epoxyqueuosine(34) reductase QueG n=1 Tax=Garciella nitratireducens TaxID=218205 RepID=UPI001BD32D49|nr:tRNA epoxyqueuosine(34) reductase QueG [Garciella nitratireducens]
MENVKEKIIEISKKIHIDCIGFTSVKPFKERKHILKEREQKGYLSGFEEEDIQKRIYPQKIFSKAQSIISIGLCYYQELETPKQKELYGNISRSSWGKDYHQVLQKKMKELMDCIEKEVTKIEYKTFVDTGPLIDREVAYRSGIGAFGKNNFIIHPKFGSWIFIGNILTNLKIQENTPIEEDICGECDLCIQACPTGALEGAYQFNAQKCVSYLTQKKDLLTEKERRSIGTNIYGCDICQLVCPKNKKVSNTCHQSFRTDGYLAFPQIKTLLNMTNKEFQEIFKPIAAGWRGKKILQRNAIIVLGNSKDSRAIPILKECLQDVRWDIRLYAIWSLSQFKKEGRKIIENFASIEKDARVKKEIQKVL